MGLYYLAPIPSDTVPPFTAMIIPRLSSIACYIGGNFSAHLRPTPDYAESSGRVDFIRISDTLVSPRLAGGKLATIHIPGLALFRCQDDWQVSLQVGPNFTPIQQSKRTMCIEIEFI